MEPVTPLLKKTPTSQPVALTTPVTVVEGLTSAAVRVTPCQLNPVDLQLVCQARAPTSCERPRLNKATTSANGTHAAKIKEAFLLNAFLHLTPFDLRSPSRPSQA